jgi:hypothetical protein
MKRILFAIFGVLSAAGAAEAQMTDAQLIERALMAAPARARETTAVVKWNADHSYTQIKEGSGTLVCYDHSGAAGEQPFSMQCTHPGNLARVQQNYRFEAQAAGNRETLNQLIADAERNGTRVQPVYGSPWIALTGPDQASANRHMTIATPNATSATTGGLPENGREGGAWIMGAGTGAAHIMVPGM